MGAVVRRDAARPTGRRRPRGGLTARAAGRCWWSGASGVRESGGPHGARRELRPRSRECGRRRQAAMAQATMVTSAQRCDVMNGTEVACWGAHGKGKGVRERALAAGREAAPSARGSKNCRRAVAARAAMTMSARVADVVVGGSAEMGVAETRSGGERVSRLRGGACNARPNGARREPVPGARGAQDASARGGGAGGDGGANAEDRRIRGRRCGKGR